MKIKNILVIAITILFVFLIYLTTLDRKVYYVNLGDDVSFGENNYGIQIKKYLEKKKKLEKYISEFSTKDYRTTDLIRDIKDNKKIIMNGNVQTIKNALIKADLLTLSIGMNDIYYKIVTSPPKACYEYIDQVLLDIEKLFALVREYCKEDIIFLNYYNAHQSEYEALFEYVNEKLNNLGNIYDIKIIDTTYAMKNKTLQDRWPNKEEFETIYQNMKQIIDNNLFH